MTATSLFPLCKERLKRKAVFKGMEQSFHEASWSRVNKPCEYMCLCAYKRHLRTGTYELWTVC